MTEKKELERKLSKAVNKIGNITRRGYMMGYQTQLINDILRGMYMSGQNSMTVEVKRVLDECQRLQKENTELHRQLTDNLMEELAR